MLENPYLPKQKPRFVIIDLKADNNVVKKVESYGITVLKTKKCKQLQDPVCTHPDMVLHFIDNSMVVVAPNVYEYYFTMLRNKGIKVIKGGKTLSRNYPEDIAYNVARIGKYAFHNLKYTDEVLKYYLQKSGIEMIHVNQGYAKCSVAPVSNISAITSDIAICGKIKMFGIDCLYIDPNAVNLKGYDCGFIGGSIGALTNKIYLASGKILDKEVNKRIESFISEYGYDYIEASTDQITDLGTILTIQ